LVVLKPKEKDKNPELKREMALARKGGGFN
jgi:hypothetical protein